MNCKNVFIFFGPPGSGKGTQSDMLAAKLKIPVISTGEILRQEEEKKTFLGKKIKKIIKTGQLVSNKLIKKLIEKRLKNKDTAKGFVLDGYPRDKKQFFDFFKKDKYNIFVILIKLSNQKIIKRLANRRVCSCGASYHLEYNPPQKKNVCDFCGKYLIFRDDDRVATIKKRLKLYYQETLPVAMLAGKKGKLIIIDGSQSIKIIHQKILNKLKYVQKN